MVNNYVPKQGDICYVDLNPIIGHEQAGKRPVVVISNQDFNKYTNMAIVCPISSNTKQFASHYLLNNPNKVKGSVLCEHIKSIDYKARNMTFFAKIDENDFEEIINLIFCIFK